MKWLIGLCLLTISSVVCAEEASQKLCDMNDANVKAALANAVDCLNISNNILKGAKDEQTKTLDRIDKVWNKMVLADKVYVTDLMVDAQDNLEKGDSLIKSALIDYNNGIKREVDAGIAYANKDWFECLKNQYMAISLYNTSSDSSFNSQSNSCMAQMDMMEVVRILEMYE